MHSTQNYSDKLIHNEMNEVKKYINIRMCVDEGWTEAHQHFDNVHLCVLGFRII